MINSINKINYKSPFVPTDSYISDFGRLVVTLPDGTQVSSNVSLDGNIGEKGIKGDTGIVGLDGADGLNGTDGLALNYNASGTLIERDNYDLESELFSFLDTDTNELYYRQTSTSGVWSDAIPYLVQGEKGDQGDQGIKGFKGLQGDQGDQGIQGSKGDRGSIGSRGQKGAQGARGKVGFGLIPDKYYGILNIQDDENPIISGTPEDDDYKITYENESAGFTILYYIEDNTQGSISEGRFYIKNSDIDYEDWTIINVDSGSSNIGDDTEFVKTNQSTYILRDQTGDRFTVNLLNSDVTRNVNSSNHLNTFYYTTDGIRTSDYGVIPNNSSIVISVEIKESFIVKNGTIESILIPEELLLQFDARDDIWVSLPDYIHEEELYGNLGESLNDLMPWDIEVDSNSESLYIESDSLMIPKDYITKNVPNSAPAANMSLQIIWPTFAGQLISGSMDVTLKLS